MTTPVHADYHIPDVREILLVLWRRRSMMIAIAAVIVALAVIAIMMRPNVYKAVSDVMIEDQNLNLTDMSDMTAAPKFDERTIVTEVNILTSPSLALQTIKAANLNTIKEFKGDKPEDAVPAFLSRLEVKPQGTSRVIAVAFSSKDPQLAAKIANAHVQSYMNFKIEAKKKRIADMGKLFEEKVQDLKNDVTKKAQAAEAYRAENNLVYGKTDQELVYEQISNTSDKLSPLELHKFDVQARLKAIEDAEKSGNPDAVADVVNSPLIQSLKQQKGIVAQQSGNVALGPNHPKRLMVGGQMGQINAQIKAEVANIKESLRRDLQATIDQETMLKESLGNLETQANSQREKTIVLKSLEMEKEASQKILDSFLANYQNMQSQVSFARSDALQISPAIAPAYPDGLSKKMLLLIAAFFAGCVALAAVFVVEVMRGGVRNFQDLERMGQNTLGILPMADGSNVVPLVSRSSSYREAIKRIYMSSLMNSDAKTILVTSALPAEGRTHVVTALGAYLASLNHKVIVIDADFLRPSWNAAGGAGPGLVDVLSGRAGLDQAIARDAANGLSVLRAGKDAMSHPDSLRSERFRQLLSDLKSRYDYVLIDSGPLLSHSEASVISSQADGIIAVVEWLRTSRKDISSMFTRLSRLTTPVLGVVLNKVDIDKYKNSNTGSDFLLPKIGHA